MRANFEANATAQFRVLSRDECEKVAFAMMEVLWRTGVAVEYARARQILADGGANVQGNRVRIPNDMVQRALDSAPPRFTVYSRGDPACNLYIEPNRVYFGPGPTCPYFLDPETKERRRYIRKDAAATALTCDALPNISFVESLGAIGDVRQTLADVYEFYEMIQQTVKPIVAWSFGLDACRDIHKMAIAVAGSPDVFDLRPNYIFYAEPMSPLHSGKDALQKLMYCAEHNIPLVYTPCPIAGGTAPATLAGVLVTALAESLHGLVLSQLIRPGHGFIAGGVVSIMDMADTTLAYGAPELPLLSAALADVLKYLGIPMWSTGGCTDAKVVDQQAAIESAISCVMAGLSGANLIHDVGFIEGAMTGSLQMLVMSDEIIGMVRRLQRGVRVDEETLAVDVIDSVGPGGHFLAEDHTLTHYRSEFWFPTLMDRQKFAKWDGAGRKAMGDRIDAKLYHILGTHKPVPVSDQAKQAMDAILSAAEEREQAKERRSA